MAPSLAIVTLLASCESAPTTSPISPADPSFLVVAGDGQGGPPGAELPDPLVVSAEDSRGRPLRGQIVVFRVVAGGGSVFAGVAITDQQGLAKERWTLGPSGPQRVEARAVDSGTGAAITFGVFTATVRDLAPPGVTRESASPNPALTSDFVHLTAEATDAFTGGSAITSAEYQVDGGAFLAMTAVDGAFDEPTEDVAADLQAPSAGVHEICMRATDAFNNPSVLTCLDLTVNEPQLAVFVSPIGSNLNPGTMALPVQTIEAGLDLAGIGGLDRVNVAAGNYAEVVVLRSGISLFGGYDAASWQRDPALYVTTIAPLSDGPAVVGTSVSGLTVDGFSITGADGSVSDRSSYALTLNLSTAVLVSNNVIIAGNGLAGGAGSGGTVGLAGVNGADGGAGNDDGPAGAPGLGGSQWCDVVSVMGGTGGGGGFNSATGSNGDPGSGPGFGPGGPGGAAAPIPFDTGAPGIAGGDGQEAGGGAGGSSGAAVGAATASARYQPAAGTEGDEGAPAGGGGGGEPDIVGFFVPGGGGGGGGGGSGGCGGEGGLAGGGGGGSFDILLVASSSIDITGNAMQTATGGAGGIGGDGGSGGGGGVGGPGGPGGGFVGAGGNGGNGGSGGNGGGGGGGGGGPSVGILADASSLFTQTGNTFTLGQPGAGGTGGNAGGGNPGADGAAGVVGNVVTLAP